MQLNVNNSGRSETYSLLYLTDILNVISIIHNNCTLHNIIFEGKNREIVHILVNGTLEKAATLNEPHAERSSVCFVDNGRVT